MRRLLVATSMAATCLLALPALSQQRVKIGPGGVEVETVVLGNVHATHGRERVTDSVYLSREELEALVRYTEQGGDVQIQTFPGERMKLEVSPDGVVTWSKH